MLVLASPAGAQTAQARSGPPPSPSTPATPNDIIVTASPLDAVTPTIVAKVDRAAIVDAGGAEITDALVDIPGISGSGFAPGANRPIIRGMDAARVRILENGTSIADVSDIGPDHGIPIDPLSAQSIEVVRGAGTLRYGSQAIGGVVNVINNRVPRALPADAVGGEIDGAYGSVNDSGEGAVLIDARAGAVALHADGFYRSAGDYATPLGVQPNSFFRGHGENAGASVFFGQDKANHVGVAIERYDAKYGIPSDDGYIVMRQTKLLTRSFFALGSGTLRSLTVDATYGDYAHDEDDPDGTLDTVFRNKEVDGRAEILLGAIGPVRSSAVGVEIQHRDFSAIGEDAAYLSPTTTDAQAGYLFTETPLGASLSLQAAGRVEHVRVTGTPASDVPVTRDYTPLSGSIGLLYATGPTKLGLTFSSTGRAPLITELFARGGHDGPQTYETGDPNLAIERANSLEATLRVDGSRLRFEGSIYSTWFNNYIYGQLTGRTCDDDGLCTDDDLGELRELFYRQQHAWFRGAEAEAHVVVTGTQASGFALRALADYTRATLDDGSNVPRIPPYRVGGGVDYRSDRIDAGVLFVHAGRQDHYGLFDTPTPGYNQLTAQVSLHPFSAHPGISLAVVGQNLTNDVQRNAAALNKDLVVLPGRGVRLVLRAATF